MLQSCTLILTVVGTQVTAIYTVATTLWSRYGPLNAQLQHGRISLSQKKQHFHCFTDCRIPSHWLPEKARASSVLHQVGSGN